MGIILGTRVMHIEEHVQTLPCQDHPKKQRRQCGNARVMNLRHYPYYANLSPKPYIIYPRP